MKGWKDYFSTFVGGDEVTAGKPSPEIFLEAAKRLNREPSSCLVIEVSMCLMRVLLHISRRNNCSSYSSHQPNEADNGIIQQQNDGNTPNEQENGN
ncbi:hypothetical protein GOBAR_AA21219 [Gossypium barbadense]|uniref:Uncharacterized protein n=1 Tax=Gossypium barbadense TaxID=3634 RepID=A0A2P5X7Y4_GOSBA|nr:hypothetical protein GOBAR_AA21219 [Gossypium barbadense]